MFKIFSSFNSLKKPFAIKYSIKEEGNYKIEALMEDSETEVATNENL